jgi:hypothetical protein
MVPPAACGRNVKALERPERASQSLLGRLRSRPAARLAKLLRPAAAGRRRHGLPPASAPPYDDLTACAVPPRAGDGRGRREPKVSARRLCCKAALVLALVGTLGAAQGCTSPGAASVFRYIKYRAQDFVEMADVGVTVTFKPCWGFYWNSLDLLVAGYCNIDGYFIGLGGNQIGITRCYADCIGLGISHERIGWGKFDKNDDSTLYVRYGGLAGLPSLVTGGRPDYTPACVHFFPHIGFVGLVWNARWFQILDFIAGFATLDLARDDGCKFGSWPWQKDLRPPKPVAAQKPVEHASVQAPRVSTDSSPRGRALPPPSPRNAAPVQAVATPPAPPGVSTAPVASPVIARRAPEPARARPAPPVFEQPAPEPARALPAPTRQRTYTVQPGDTLYGIAARMYGDGNRWTDIQQANRSAVPDVHTLRPGTLLTLP